MIDLHQLKISEHIAISEILDLIRNSTTEFIIISDIHTKIVKYPDLIEIDRKSLLVPQILLVNKDTGTPIGNVVNHVTITQSMKIQSIHARPDMTPDYIPNCVVGHKSTLLRLISKCESSEYLFLELSLIIKLNDYNTKLINGFIASTYINNKNVEIRSKLSNIYMPVFSGLFDFKNVGRTKKIFTDRKNYASKLGFGRLINIVRGNDVLLTDSDSEEYNLLKFGYRTFSINHDVDADYYIALHGTEPQMFDPSRSFMQLNMASASDYGVIDTSTYNPIGTFCIKQYSDNISFCPPYTASSNNILTALEIILSFKPRSLAICSDVSLNDLFVNDNQESVRRQSFMTKIIRFCIDNNIKLKLISDICSTF